MDEIVVNGTSYAGADEMTPEHRQVFLHAVKLLSARGIDALPDTLEVFGNPDGSDLRIKATSSTPDVHVDGEEVEGEIDSLPPAMQGAVRAALGGGERSAAAGRDPAGPSGGLEGHEIEGWLQSGRTTAGAPGPGRTVKLLLYTLLGLVLVLLLLALIL